MQDEMRIPLVLSLIAWDYSRYQCMSVAMVIRHISSLYYTGTLPIIIIL